MMSLFFAVQFDVQGEHAGSPYMGILQPVPFMRYYNVVRRLGSLYVPSL